MLAGTFGTALAITLGILTDLYAPEIRNVLDASGPALLRADVLPMITALVGSVTTLVAYRLFTGRRQHQVRVTQGKFVIDSDAIGDTVGDDVVAGRSLHYLETWRKGEDLIVCLHGLGLDASDFRPYMVESSYHCVALTLYGFNASERNDPRYPAISLASHAQLVIYALRRLREKYPRKRISLVGFSFGADMIVCLADLATNAFEDLRPRSLVLLDPNVNNTTTTISSKISLMGDDENLEDLMQVLHSAENVAEFRYLCGYLENITSKSFAQIRGHAREVIRRYASPSVEPFVDALGRLSSIEETVHVFLSHSHENVFSEVVKVARARGMDLGILTCSPRYHFDLISPGFMKEVIEPLLDGVVAA